MRVLPLKFPRATILRATRAMRIPGHADAGGDDQKSQAIHPEVGIATEMRAVDAPNMLKEMTKAMNLARKYDRPIQKKKLTKKAHDHDLAVAAVAGVAEDAIAMRAETENRTPNRTMTMTPC